MNAGVLHLQTSRMLGQPLSEAHFADIRSLHRDLRVMKTLSPDGDMLSDQVTREGIAANVAHWRQHGYGLWVFHSRDDGQFIGRGGLRIYRLDDEDQVGLAYAVVSRYWNAGLATEMATACLDAAFGPLSLPSVASWTLPINMAAQHVMIKLGFRYDRDFVFAGLPHQLYRLSAAEWQANR